MLVSFTVSKMYHTEWMLDVVITILIWSFQFCFSTEQVWEQYSYYTSLFLQLWVSDEEHGTSVYQFLPTETEASLLLIAVLSGNDRTLWKLP